MRVTILGSGDSFGSGGRFNTCFMVEASDRKVLLDFGASSLIALRTRDIDANSIDGVILSHLHGDHFGGLPFLLLDAQYLSRRRQPLVIAGPPGTRDRLTTLLEVFFPLSSKTGWRFPWEVIEIIPNRPAEVLGLAIATTEVVHQSGAPSTAIRLFDGRSTLAYSGDTEWTDALITVADGADLFIVECYEHERNVTGHLSWTVLKTHLAELRARRIMITHMNPTMLARIDEAKSAGLLVAEDGLAVDL